MNELFKQPDEDNFTIDPNKNYLEELVGENKKFKDHEALAKGKAEADGYIKVLERKLDAIVADNKTLRDDYLKLDTDYKSRASVEELIDRISTQKQLPTSDNTPSDRNEPPMLDPTKLDELFSQKYHQMKTAERQEENYKKVVSTLQERYGENFQDVLRKQTAELDLSEEEVLSMAKNRPNALLRLLPEPKQESFGTPPRSSVRTDNFSPTGGPKRTWSYYEKMRKEKPNQYNDPQTSIQMYEDYKLLGEAFEDGDFRRI